VRAFAGGADSVALMYFQPGAGDTIESGPQRSLSEAGYDYATYNFGKASAVALAPAPDADSSTTVAATSMPRGAAQQPNSNSLATSAVTPPQVRRAPISAAQFALARMSAIDAIFRVAGDAAAVTGPPSFAPAKR